jgi:hypothetical protein
LRSGGAARTPAPWAREEFFTSFSEARSDIVERVAIRLAARSGPVIAAVAV